MDKVEVSWEISEPRGTHYFDFQDLNVESKEEWDALSREEQRERLQDALNDMPDQTYMVVDSW